ncbi:peptidoglycan editing factor PgeF [Konateibacter massiliensis]|uniref:peptidoglycan editing factor PgeF n=1 Tax=Konateibacter massiliensis TaxID=2002841 RepID=UPI000C14B0EE|nr:peptidoglycan editing factor PgeF [Konateibacter massiliensis]
MNHINLIRKNDREDMVLALKNEVPYLFFKNIDETNQVIHGFSTKLGGVSKEHLSSMNLSYTRGDDEENVNENYRRITKAMGVEYESLVLSQQTHTTNVRTVTRADRGKGIVRERDYEDVDGLITNEAGVTLVTFYADCVPLYFVDPVHHAIGLSHSGWRGTVNKMGKKTVERMQEEYGSNPKDMIAAIGPSICIDCYEVSREVIDEFEKNFGPEIIDKICYRKKNGKYQLDLWEINRYVLMEAGILEEHISVSAICTCCNQEIFYSHRATQGMRGNLAAFLALKE